MCPIGGVLFDGFSRGLKAHLVGHCLLVETNRGLVLVDTGFGTRDIQSPYSRLSPFFIHFNGIQFDRKYTAVDRIQQLGFSPRDVRHIVLTHLDFDHAGGLEDFPEATVHVMQAQMDGPQHARGFIGRGRYRAQQWDEVKNWKFYAPGGEAWFGFEAVRDLEGLPPESLMVPLANRARGRAGIARHAPRLAAARGRRLFFPRRDGCQSALYPRLAVLPVDDGGRSHNSVVQSKPAVGAIDRSRQ